jgi:hypothetical protein
MIKQLNLVESKMFCQSHQCHKKKKTASLRVHVEVIKLFGRKKEECLRKENECLLHILVNMS